MRYLVDTHLLLWAAADAPELPSEARQVISDMNNALYFSAASIWEIAIKSALGRDDFMVDPKEFLAALSQNGYLELPISAAHSAAVYDLPHIHRDPFDRILLAQAQLENAKLLTADETLADYGRYVELVG